MDIDDFRPFDGERLKARIQSLSRTELEELFRRFGTQYALLCQRLEALYSPDKTERFAAIRPGGLDEIDEAIRLAEQEGDTKVLASLRAYRDLNRVLAPFMDVYEEQTVANLQYLSKEELETFYANVVKELGEASKPRIQDPADYRAEQNAAGTLRLGTLMKAAILRELKDRFGVELE